mgnify:CR=1 FL=1
MDKLEDTQNEPDVRNVPIYRVGIRDLSHPIQFQDGDGSSQATVANVGLSVALGADVRGTHMSRFVSIFSEEADEISVSGLSALLDKVADRLESSGVTVRLDFPYFLTKQAPETNSLGKMDYEIGLEGIRENSKTSVHLTIRVPVTTLCPCSRNISKRGAHNQRGVVVLTVVGNQELPSVRELIAAVEMCGSSELYSVLKRPDEKHVTERAYDNPVFVEDLVRNVALRLREMTGIESYRIEGENFESIHNHNAFAIVVSGE